MSVAESDTVRELYESFQELSQEEVREFFKKIQSDMSGEDEYRLNPPWGGNPPWWVFRPWEKPNFSMSQAYPDPDRSWPDLIWPGPNWPDRPGSPGPTFPDFPEFPEFPSLYAQSARGSAFNSQQVSRPAISVTARSLSDTDRRDSNEGIPIEIDTTINSSDDPEELSIAGDKSIDAGSIAAGVVKGVLGIDVSSGSGGGGGANVSVHVHGGECTVNVY